MNRCAAVLLADALELVLLPFLIEVGPTSVDQRERHASPAALWLHHAFHMNARAAALCSSRHRVLWTNRVL